MRSIVGAAGLLCGVAVIWTVGNYGYASADDPAIKANMAFLFAVIAAGGLFGHAVAVRVWPINPFVAVLIGVVCVCALLVNLSNSLAALANRNSRTAAEATSKATAIRDDRIELTRLQKELDKIGGYATTDQAAVDAARRAADAATIAKNAECRNGDPVQRGRLCREKEEAEKTATDGLAKATAAKALTDRAAKIEADILGVRERLRVAGPIADPNALGSSLAKLFRVSDAEAGFMATMQQLFLAGIVEALIVFSMISYELMGRQEMPNDAEETQEIEADDLRPTRTVPMTQAKLPAPPRPVLVLASEEPSAGSIPKILTAALKSVAGERVEMADV